ncbi:unnamed protein product [Prorocentrum cordatum]|uniref:Uncharacterized protein n=1 Tax=Prorocentrum cordatum TaxID=2364126 RepID=A0ABN9RN60_9DINO|nr:unnamed protein product [Polarella glacialis]
MEAFRVRRRNIRLSRAHCPGTSSASCAPRASWRGAPGRLLRRGGQRHPARTPRLDGKGACVVLGLDVERRRLLAARAHAQIYGASGRLELVLADFRSAPRLLRRGEWPRASFCRLRGPTGAW